MVRWGHCAPGGGSQGGTCCQYPSLPHPTSQRAQHELLLKQPLQGARESRGGLTEEVIWPGGGQVSEGK